ncbi:MAG: GDP-L-fucose synthase [Verrucomicrobiota bacterium]
MSSSKRIFVAGHCGLVGSSIVLHIKSNYPDWEVLTQTRQELDLRNEEAVRTYLAEVQPDYVIDAAAKVGGIKANNDFPVEFLLENLAIQNSLIKAAHESGVEKLLFLGSSCIYPKHAPQPIREEHLLTGPLEPTNDAYAIAKIAGIKLCQAYRRQYGAKFISAMPTNLYGPNDNFDPLNSHVLPGLMYKMHHAKLENKSSVTLWGTGQPRREFLHADDMAAACVFLIQNYDKEEIINVGCGEDVSIQELADMIQQAVGFTGKITWDTSQPDGTPRKLLNIDRIKSLGWDPSISLQEGIRKTYQWFLENKA